MDEIDIIMQRLHYSILDKVAEHVLLPVEEELLSRFESAIGHKLPPDYRRFVQRYGGASLPDVVVMPAAPDPRLDPDDIFSVSDFFGFYAEGQNGNKCSYDLFYNYFTHRDHLPSGMIPIAESGDNLFCLSCTGTTFDHVFARLPPEFADDDPVGSYFLLAPSFRTFLQSLRMRSG